jgi:hypothetical protein
MSISSPVVSRGHQPGTLALNARLTEQQVESVVAPQRHSLRPDPRFSSIKGFLYGVIFASIVTASLPVAELAFRLLGDEPSADLRGLYTQFAGRNYKLASDVRTGARFASGFLSVFTDAYGLRADGAGRFAAKRDKPIDFLIVGDSQGFGNGVNFEDSIAGSMAALAAERGYRVSNSSVGGHSLASQLQVAKWLVEEQKLRVEHFVVLLTPAMIHSPDTLNQAIVGGDGRLYGDSTITARLRRWAKSNLVIYSRLRDAVRNVGIGADPTADATTVFSFYDPFSDQIMLQERLLRTVKAFNDFAMRHGAVVHAVYIPLTIEATFRSVSQTAAKQNVPLDPEVSFRLAATVASRLGIPLHDMRSVLREVHSSGQVLVVKGDFHYSPALSRACGATLWADLNFPNRAG